MAVLAYCIAESTPKKAAARKGVGGAAVEAFSQSGLQCFYSEFEAQDALRGEMAKDAALAFHRVVQEIFEQAAVVPFRFPTILAQRADLEGFVREHGAEYTRALARLRNKVQMDLRISTRQRSEAASAGTGTRTGAEYLRTRQAERARLHDAAQGFRRAGGSRIEGWRERELADGLRCFILADRTAISGLQSEFSGAALAPDFTARVTGPWPAAEFVDEDSQPGGKK